MSESQAPTHSRVGIEHVGITVPSIPEATEYFKHVFGAEVMFDLIPHEASEESERRAEIMAGLEDFDASGLLGVRPGSRLNAMRHLALGDGPLIELFEWTADEHRDPVIASDYGIQHICIYVDDIHGAAERVVEAGGTLLTGPIVSVGLEGGEGNFAWYTKAPWGSIVELLTYPGHMPAEDLTPILRPARRLQTR